MIISRNRIFLSILNGEFQNSLYRFTSVQLVRIEFNDEEVHPQKMIDPFNLFLSLLSC